MLILTRRIGEAINIGGDVDLRVLNIQGEHVLLGVSAPATIAVHREEIDRRIQAQAGDGIGVKHSQKQ